MRKLRSALIAAFTFAAAVTVILLIAVLPNRLAFDGGESYSFFIGDTSKDCRVVTCGGGEAAIKRLTLNGVCGESATFKSLDLEQFLAGVNGEVLFKEEFSDSVNYYCKADLPYSVTLYGRQVNLHVCVKNEGVTVASPIIFGGY